MEGGGREWSWLQGKIAKRSTFALSPAPPCAIFAAKNETYDLLCPQTLYPFELHSMHFFFVDSDSSKQAKLSDLSQIRCLSPPSKLPTLTLSSHPTRIPLLGHHGRLLSSSTCSSGIRECFHCMCSSLSIPFIATFDVLEPTSSSRSLLLLLYMLTSFSLFSLLMGIAECTLRSSVSQSSSSSTLCRTEVERIPRGRLQGESCYRATIRFLSAEAPIQARSIGRCGS